jgi:hypothetical protein
VRRSSRLVAAALLAVLLAACGGDDDSGGDGDGDLSSYVTVAQMAADLEQAGLTCTLEYEGLVDDEREVSLCAVNGEYTELSVWTDPTAAADAADAADEGADPLAAGANWTVDIDTAETAEAVADALGGEAHGTAG